MFQKLRNRYRKYRMSMRTKFVLAMSSLAAILFLSSVISIAEYRRMSDYVSDLIQANIASINMAQKLIYATEQYNLDVLAIIGEEELVRVPMIDQEAFTRNFDNLRAGFSSEKEIAMADSVAYAYSAYMLTAMEMEEVFNSRFIDTRDWYFQRLQPKFDLLRDRIQNLVEITYKELQVNSQSFQDGFYRSIVPGVVSVAAGIMLVLLLLFFVLVYYINPLHKMLEGIRGYRERGSLYNYKFDGDDELSQLNEYISDLTAENKEIRKKAEILSRQK